MFGVRWGLFSLVVTEQGASALGSAQQTCVYIVNMLYCVTLLTALFRVFCYYYARCHPFSCRTDVVLYPRHRPGGRVTADTPLPSVVCRTDYHRPDRTGSTTHLWAASAWSTCTAGDTSRVFQRAVERFPYKGIVLDSVDHIWSCVCLSDIAWTI